MQLAADVHLPHARGDEPLLVDDHGLGLVHLPHARGDEPFCLGICHGSLMHLPHARGDEPKENVDRVDAIYICPTHVGMNRKLRMGNIRIQ